MSTQPSKPRSNASRYLFLFLIGLVIGVVATVMAMRAIDARKDHFHDGVMHVQQWHLGQLKKKVEQNRCAATDVLPNLKALRTMADDLEPAFPDLADDKRFAEHASKMRARLDAALANPPLSCASVGTLAQGIGESCKGCHQDFR
ncbi:MULTISPECIES: cytochrome c [unclassified Lysobacter]|uniref:cytochrome c n=1 Tax=unclassified Lysobacter TaxID=2635362 RepID=UPI001C22684E|nr:cytochrome c [Lysobacter sp. MMG2]MBU8978133.1 cytochrome c [Lysobacter sp. MMG2]